jgi:hypothetical protein
MSKEKETEKVRRWRSRMRAEGKQAISLWLNRDAVERLNTLATEAHITVSEFIEQTVTVTQPKVTDTVTDTTVKVTDTVTDTTRKGKALTASALARKAQSLHKQGLSYAQIAERWEKEKVPTLKGGKWHRGTIINLARRYSK